MKFIAPTMTYPWHHSSNITNTCRAYCASVLWPTLSPAASISEVSGMTWAHLVMHEPILMRAITFSSLSHQRLQWLNRFVPDCMFGEREQHYLRVCEMETIALLNQELKKSDRAASNPVILSVMCMAHNAIGISEEQQFRHVPFTAPMRRLQRIDVHGGLRPNLMHFQGLISLIKLRGGLEAIDLPGLAPVVSLSDIVTSTAYHTPPSFPFLPLQVERKNYSLQEMLGYTMADVDRHYGRLRRVGLTTEVMEVFYAMDVYMSIVDVYLKGNHIRTNYSLMADQRNMVQYTLLTLPPISQLARLSSYYQHHEVLYEACRLAGCIYGSGVIFPLPPQSTPLAELSGLLKGTLKASDSLTGWKQPHARIALFWVVTLGGIAAEGTMYREWYVSTLLEMTRYSQITCWADLRAIVVMLPWYDDACNDAGESLWLEISQQKDVAGDDL
ncbi:hypothetical protein BDV37DRAFT_289632 [Aspergillus pseudonomiae]|uniref:Fungal-specific transcription factor domain-containing protein n=1 Tax=Aspergillus pseudonomiae TaxID=1506151 RepID=A0A5N7CSH1_9EURO|nr:uncharacterized protein BDV37DRAFT_289632 [Aspergillus pseudonomiae]KAE8397192.1 hypothetical protein BDV37DRAFT_289632 [Aspergillus pseudonomiae]